MSETTIGPLRLSRWLDDWQITHVPTGLVLAYVPGRARAERAARVILDRVGDGPCFWPDARAAFAPAPPPTATLLRGLREARASTPGLFGWAQYTVHNGPVYYPALGWCVSPAWGEWA